MVYKEKSREYESCMGMGILVEVLKSTKWHVNRFCLLKILLTSLSRMEKRRHLVWGEGASEESCC